MAVLVDTPVWSLVFRRSPANLNEAERLVVAEFDSLIAHGQARLPGMVRLEVLSGLRDRARFVRLRSRLRAFEDLALTVEDYETGALFTNRCLDAGVAPTDIDMLLCALAARLELEIMTLDQDFERYAQVLQLRLYRAGG